MTRVLSSSAGSRWRSRGPGALGAIALSRGEPVNGVWFVVAAGCMYLVGLPLLLGLHRRPGARRSTTPAPLRPSASTTGATSCPPTSGWCSAITSPRSPDPGRWSARRWPRSSAICRERSGSWSGAVLGGCVQDFVILFCSMRRDGQSLGPDGARRGRAGAAGSSRWSSVLAIMIILLAVVALVVVNALKALALGHLHPRHDHPDRDAHGPLHALLAARARARGLGASASSLLLAGGGGGPLGRALAGLGAGLHLTGPALALVRHRLRLRRLGSAGVAAARARATT